MYASQTSWTEPRPVLSKVFLQPMGIALAHATELLRALIAWMSEKALLARVNAGEDGTWTKNSHWTGFYMTSSEIDRVAAAPLVRAAKRLELMAMRVSMPDLPKPAAT